MGRMTKRSRNRCPGRCCGSEAAEARVSGRAVLGWVGCGDLSPGSSRLRPSHADSTCLLQVDVLKETNRTECGTN